MTLGKVSMAKPGRLRQGGELRLDAAAAGKNSGRSAL